MEPTVSCFQPQNLPAWSPCPKSNPFPILRHCLFQEVFPELGEPPLKGIVLFFYTNEAD